jgi:hypothetical protein
MHRKPTAREIARAPRWNETKTARRGSLISREGAGRGVKYPGVIASAGDTSSSRMAQVEGSVNTRCT